MEVSSAQQTPLEKRPRDVAGNGFWSKHSKRLRTSCVPWAPKFFQHCLQMTWLNDLANPDLPWVKSYHSPGQIHLADWIAFSLDLPSWIEKRANKEIKWAKQICERSALSLQQIAEAVRTYYLAHFEDFPLWRLWLACYWRNDFKGYFL